MKYIKGKKLLLSITIGILLFPSVSKTMDWDWYTSERRAAESHSLFGQVVKKALEAYRNEHPELLATMLGGRITRPHPCCTTSKRLLAYMFGGKVAEDTSTIVLPSSVIQRARKSIEFNFLIVLIIPDLKRKIPNLIIKNYAEIEAEQQLYQRRIAHKNAGSKTIIINDA